MSLNLDQFVYRVIFIGMNHTNLLNSCCNLYQKTITISLKEIVHTEFPGHIYPEQRE